MKPARCTNTVHTKSKRLRAAHGPFIYCGRPLVDGEDACRTHLRSRLCGLEKEVQRLRRKLEAPDAEA